MNIIQWTPNQDLANAFPEFFHIQIYGSNEDPHFLAGDVEILLGFQNIQYDQVFDEGKEYKKLFSVSSGNLPYSQIFLTERGLYGMLWRKKHPMADRFKDFITIVIRELRHQSHVELTENIKKLDALLNEKHIKFIEQQKLSEKYRMQIHDNADLIKRNIVSPEYKLQQMKEKYFKRLYVYVEPIPNELVDQVPPYEESDDRILSVSLVKRLKDELGIIYVPPRLKVDDISFILEDYALDYKKNRYHSSFEDLSTIFDSVKL